MDCATMNWGPIPVFLRRAHEWSGFKQGLAECDAIANPGIQPHRGLTFISLFGEPGSAFPICRFCTATDALGCRRASEKRY